MTQQVRFCRERDVLRRFGIARSLMWRQMAEGTFPRPVRLGKRAIGWLEHELDAHAASLVAASRPEGSFDVGR